MYSKILIAIDLNDLNKAKDVVQQVLTLTNNNPDAIYRVISVIEPVDNSLIAAFLPKNFDQSVVEEANKALHQFTQTHFPTGSKVQHIVAYGTVYEEICQVAKTKETDLIVMLASSKKHAQGLSTNTVRVLRQTDKPVLLLR